MVLIAIYDIDHFICWMNECDLQFSPHSNQLMIARSYGCSRLNSELEDTCLKH